MKWSTTTPAQTLATGEYEWRVRRQDAATRFGGASDRSSFTVAESLVVLDSPTANGTVAPRDAVFLWHPLSRSG